MPIPEICGNAIKKATDEMLQKETFRGYGPEQGYDFLREKIAKYDYETLGISIDKNEIFVSDGAKCDTGNIGEIFGNDNIIAITDPVYPVYLDTNVMSGRSGKYNEKTGMFENIIYMPATFCTRISRRSTRYDLFVFTKQSNRYNFNKRTIS